MPGPEFFQTRMGHVFFETTVPRIASALERIATALERPQPAQPSLAAVAASLNERADVYRDMPPMPHDPEFEAAARIMGSVFRTIATAMMSGEVETKLIDTLAEQLASSPTAAANEASWPSGKKRT